MGFSREEYLSELPVPSPEDLPNAGIKPGFLALQADTLPSGPPWKPHMLYMLNSKMRGRRKWSELRK